MSENDNSDLMHNLHSFKESESENDFLLSSFIDPINRDSSVIENTEYNEIEITNTSKKKHSQNSPDNILRKIQIHFFNFIRLFVNDILKAENIKIEFLKMNHFDKFQTNKKDFQLFKNKNIGEVIKNNISRKYTKHEKDTNSKIIDNNKKNEILSKILSIKNLLLFKKIYYKSYKKINLKEFEIDKEYTLSEDVKMFKDLLKDNEKYGKNYVKNIHLSALKNFLPDYIFYYDYDIK